MDWESGWKRLTEYIIKYRYFVFILLAGVAILLMPEQTDTPAPLPPSEAVQDLQTQLEDILNRIDGVGAVQVLLTEASGCNTVYQMDENRNQSNLDTVIVMNNQREESGLIKQVISPEYRGAVIVCQGANQAEVRLAVVNAVRSVTGLSSDRIAVLKMN